MLSVLFVSQNYLNTLNIFMQKFCSWNLEQNKTPHENQHPVNIYVGQHPTTAQHVEQHSTPQHAEKHITHQQVEVTNIPPAPPLIPLPPEMIAHTTPEQRKGIRAIGERLKQDLKAKLKGYKALSSDEIDRRQMLRKSSLNQ
jgi:hypothetical protein